MVALSSRYSILTIELGGRFIPKLLGSLFALLNRFEAAVHMRFEGNRSDVIDALQGGEMRAIVHHPFTRHYPLGAAATERRIKLIFDMDVADQRGNHIKFINRVSPERPRHIRRVIVDA